MTHADHFEVIDDTIGAQPWMQLRQVATAQVDSVSKSYGTAGGGNKNDLVQTVQTHWTNNAPMSQWVYGMVTRGGCQVTLQARSRGYLSMAHAVDISADGAGLASTVEVSRAGGGADIGVGGLLAVGSGFATHEVRFNSGTIPLMPHINGWYLVAPGEKINARVEVRFISEFWESSSIDGGDQSTESLFVTGITRLDLYAVPSVLPPPLRPVPSIVGWEYDDTITGDTTVDVPPGTAAGDVILAISANHFGVMTELTAVEPGWTELHARDGGFADVHMKIWARIADDSEPATYSFGNGFLAQQITQLITLRNTDLPTTWYIASNLSHWKLFEEQVAPSITRQGQLLLAASYISHPGQSVTQTEPTGMTEMSDINVSASSLAVASLANPPFPTRDRKFTPSIKPIFSGHSITATILIPGTPPFTG